MQKVRMANLDIDMCNVHAAGTIAMMEAAKVHEACGSDFLTITPGIRFADGEIGDQVRVMTPEQARKNGADYIVVGRPITQAADQLEVYRRCKREFCGV